MARSVGWLAAVRRRRAGAPHRDRGVDLAGDRVKVRDLRRVGSSDDDPVLGGNPRTHRALDRGSECCALGGQAPVVATGLGAVDRGATAGCSAATTRVRSTDGTDRLLAQARAIAITAIRRGCPRSGERLRLQRGVLLVSDLAAVVQI